MKKTFTVVSEVAPILEAAIAARIQKIGESEVVQQLVASGRATLPRFIQYEVTHAEETFVAFETTGLTATDIAIIFTRFGRMVEVYINTYVDKNKRDDFQIFI